MRLPLVVLAVCRVLRRHLRPALGAPRLLRELAGPGLLGHPVQRPSGFGAAQWALALTDAAARASSASSSAFGLWRGTEVDKPDTRAAVPPAGLVLGRLLRHRHRSAEPKLATFFAWVVDARVIDGAVNGTANLVRATGSAARKLQSGYVRNYALGIALGMAALIVFLLSRTWWS